MEGRLSKTSEHRMSETRKSSMKRHSSNSKAQMMSSEMENQGRRKVSISSAKEKEENKVSPVARSSVYAQLDNKNEPLKEAFDKIKHHFDSLHLMTLFEEFIKRGICPTEDDRLVPVRDELSNIYRGRLLTDIDLNYELFKKVTEPISLLLVKVVNDNLALHDIEGWNKCLTVYHLAVKNITGKDVAVSITSADGQRLKWGPTKSTFPLTELLHLVTYLMAVDSLGFSSLHGSIGLQTKPKSEWKPANPFVGAGALAVAAQLVTKAMSNRTSTDRHEAVKKILYDLTGGYHILFDSKSFVGSDRKSEYLKAVLCWMISTNNQDLNCQDVDKIVQFYLECSSLQLDTDALSVIGATLANGGTCATTGVKVFCSECVEKVLSVMTVSSEKSGVPILASSSGAVLVIVPGVLGVAVHSDEPMALGYFISALFRHFALNPYERTFLQMGREKATPCLPISILFHSARTGDIMTLSSLLTSGACLTARDYMSRTVLHIAAARGHHSYIEFILEFCPELVIAKDIMGRTALDEARTFQQSSIAKFLENWEAVSMAPSSANAASSDINVPAQTDRKSVQ